MSTPKYGKGEPPLCNTTEKPCDQIEYKKPTTLERLQENNAALATKIANNQKLIEVLKQYPEAATEIEKVAWINT